MCKSTQCYVHEFQIYTGKQGGPAPWVTSFTWAYIGKTCQMSVYLAIKPTLTKGGGDRTGLGSIDKIPKRKIPYHLHRQLLFKSSHV